MDYSEELAAISKPAYRLQKVGHLAVTVAFLAMAAFFLLGAIGLLNEWVGLSSRPRGQWPFLAMMAAAPLIGGGLASLGLFLKYTSDWIVHRRGLQYAYRSNSYVSIPASAFPYKQRAAMLVSCLFLHIPHFLLRWWRALPD